MIEIITEYWPGLILLSIFLAPFIILGALMVLALPIEMVYGSYIDFMERKHPGYKDYRFLNSHLRKKEESYIANQKETYQKYIRESERNKELRKEIEKLEALVKGLNNTLKNIIKEDYDMLDKNIESLEKLSLLLKLKELEWPEPPGFPWKSNSYWANLVCKSVDNK